MFALIACQPIRGSLYYLCGGEILQTARGSPRAFPSSVGSAGTAPEIEPEASSRGDRRGESESRRSRTEDNHLSRADRRRQMRRRAVARDDQFRSLHQRGSPDRRQLSREVQISTARHCRAEIPVGFPSHCGNLQLIISDEAIAELSKMPGKPLLGSPDRAGSKHSERAGGESFFRYQLFGGGYLFYG